MVKKYTGQKAHVWIDSGNGEVITTGSTNPGTKYFVMNKADNSSIAVPEGVIFQSPMAETQITLAAGDRLYRIDEDRFCKTSASFELSEGAVDVGDDCHPASQIADGVTAFSGSMSGLFRYDPVTDDVENVTMDILNKFMTVIKDSGSGSYSIHEKDDAQAYILTHLNSDAGPGQIETWLFAPIVITSMSLSLGHTDPQSKDVSFVLGHGSPIIYQVPAAA